MVFDDRVPYWEESGGIAMYLNTEELRMASRTMQSALEGGNFEAFKNAGLSVGWWQDNNGHKFRNALEGVSEKTDSQFLRELALYPLKCAEAYEAIDREMARRIRGLF